MTEITDLEDKHETQAKGIRRTEPHETKPHHRHRVLHLLLRIGGAVLTAKRAQKHSQYIAEDLVEDVAHAIKKRPFQSVAIGAALAFGAGTIIGWICSPKTSVSKRPC
jgi:hypothetical protein